MQTAEPTKAWAATRRAIAEAIASIDATLPGSVVVRHMPCGKLACGCKADPPALHGPYIQWTRTVEGRTVTRYLSPEQLARYQPWFDNARRLKELIAKLEVASVQAFEVSERRHRPGTNAAPPATRRRRSSRNPGT
jgi:hypothetical protein